MCLTFKLSRAAYWRRLERLVMEASGRYEFSLAEAAHSKGLPVCIVRPLSVSRYAGAINQLRSVCSLPRLTFFEICEFAM